jgi:hypothetical protein
MTSAILNVPSRATQHVTPPAVVHPSKHRATGVRTYYVASDGTPGTTYAVQHIRKRGMNRWQCSCPQFFFRCAARRRHCKHIRAVRLAAAAA